MKMLKVTCLNCGNTFATDSYELDDLGWHTTCPECGASFDIDYDGNPERKTKYCVMKSFRDYYTVEVEASNEKEAIEKAKELDDGEWDLCDSGFDMDIWVC